jgi:hypothetical protein
VSFFQDFDRDEMPRPLLSIKYARWVDAHLVQRMQLSSVTTRGTGISSTAHVRTAASTKESPSGPAITRMKPPILPLQQSSANPGKSALCVMN